MEVLLFDYDYYIDCGKRIWINKHKFVVVCSQNFKVFLYQFDKFVFVGADHAFYNFLASLLSTQHENVVVNVVFLENLFEELCVYRALSAHIVSYGHNSKVLAVSDMHFAKQLLHQDVRLFVVVSIVDGRYFVVSL